MKDDFIPHEHFGFLTNRVGRLINELAQEKIVKEGYDFAPSCIGILADLWEKDGVTQKELGTSLIKNKSSINKMLESLESNGLIEKKVHPNDKRNKLIFLTQEGKKFKTHIMDGRKYINNHLLSEVKDKDVTTCLKVLNELYNRLSENR